MRDYLVFVRAGGRSLHPRLIAEDPGRNWDCCVSWHVPPTDGGIAEFYETGGDNKMDAFDAFYRAARNRPYRYFLVVDDDIYFRPGDVSRFLSICDRRQLFLSQPALRWGTNANFAVTLWNPVCEVRQVSFVEVMAPCFSHAAVDRLSCTFHLSRSTWGIDEAWSSLLRDTGQVAIVDAVRVEHTKPVDLAHGEFYQKLRRMGVDPTEEHRKARQEFPGAGAPRTLRSGHQFAAALPGQIGGSATAAMEVAKKVIHRTLRLGGRVAALRHPWVAARAPAGEVRHPTASPASDTQDHVSGTGSS